MSWLAALNFIVVQWAGVRIARVTEADGRHVRWTIIGPVLPLTGWWGPYVGRARALR